MTRCIVKSNIEKHNANTIPLVLTQQPSQMQVIPSFPMHIDERLCSIRPFYDHILDDASTCITTSTLFVWNVLTFDIFTTVISFLNILDLTTSELACKEWHHRLQDPYVWQEYYCITWRHDVPLPRHVQQDPLLLSKLREICRKRIHTSFRVSTRAEVWVYGNGNLMIHNDCLDREFHSGGIESIRTETRLQPLALSLALKDSNICYFEATISGCGSIGIVSISVIRERLSYGYGSSHHVGWFPVSYGYHGDNGKLYWNDGVRAPMGGYEIDYNTSWGSTTPTKPKQVTVVGCGYDQQSHQLFFTRNGHFLGIAPVKVDPTRVYGAAVSLHNVGDYCELNMGKSAFTFDIEQYIMNVYAMRR